MKGSAFSLVAAAFALLLGLVIGGFGPRREARELREALDRQPEAECEDRGQVSREIASVFRGRPIEDRMPSGTSDVPDAADEGQERSEDGTRGRRDAARDAGDEPDDPEESLRLAKEAMELRRTQARAALEEAGATEEQLAAVDAAMEAMNQDLADLTQEFVSGLDDGPPDRRQMMVFAADTLDVLLAAEDSLYGTFDADLRAGLDTAALDPFSYLDGRVVEQLVKLQDL